MNQAVRITGYSRSGLKVISLIKLIREVSGDGLATTKNRVDQFLGTGAPLELLLTDPDVATDFANRARSLAAIVDHQA